MEHKLRTLGDVQSLLFHLDVLLLEPIPPHVPDEMVQMVSFARDCVWWILQDPRGKSFGLLVEGFKQAERKVESQLRHERN